MVNLCFWEEERKKRFWHCPEQIGAEGSRFVTLITIPIHYHELSHWPYPSWRGTIPNSAAGHSRFHESIQSHLIRAFSANTDYTCKPEARKFSWNVQKNNFRVWWFSRATLTTSNLHRIRHDMAFSCTSWFNFGNKNLNRP